MDHFKNINSLDSLRRRKRRIKRELKECEDNLLEDIATVSEPFTSLFQSDDNGQDNDSDVYGYGCNNNRSGFFYNVLKGVKNAKRIGKIVGLAKDIYFDYKR